MTAPVFVLVPVKPLHRGKSRLRGVPSEVRRRLALAFALDVLEAATTAPGVTRVIAVTDDPRLTVLEPGAPWGSAPDRGSLNASLTGAAATLPPQATVIALCADLPTVRPEDLAELVADLPPGRPVIVPDMAGTGTTAYAAPRSEFSPAFGPASRAAHHKAGASEIGLHRERLRTDVDTMDDLRRALTLGVGRHTAAVLRAAPNATRGHRRGDGPAVAS